ncbi:MAG: response regulator [Alphaproteobacteria bacterium]|nr:response regulator [Alphaproteobacteria bacterium]MBO6864244.1 response regulator [Alphaproteobacteria bacterium]
MNILLVEDDEVDRMLFHRALKKAGAKCTVVDATDGAEALELLQTLIGSEGRSGQAPNTVIVTDINMPRMNGHEFVAAVRENPDLAKAVVFVYSTSATEEDRQLAYSRHVAGYLLKRGDDNALKDIGSLFDVYSRTVELPDA